MWVYMGVCRCMWVYVGVCGCMYACMYVCLIRLFTGMNQVSETTSQVTCVEVAFSGARCAESRAVLLRDSIWRAKHHQAYALAIHQQVAISTAVAVHTCIPGQMLNPKPRIFISVIW